MGGLQASDLDHPRRPSRHGQDRARHQHRLQHRQGLSRRGQARRRRWRRSTAASSASSRSKCRPSNWRPASSPSSPASPPTRSAAATSPSSEFHRIAEAMHEMQSIPFYIDQTGGISIAQLTARARRLKRQRGLDLLVIDYLQLLSGSKTRADNRVQELTEITTGLKALAKELNVPILGALPALAPGRAARRQAAAALGPARIRLDRAGRRRRAVRLSRGILPQEQGAARPAPRSTSTGWPRWSARTAAPK